MKHLVLTTIAAVVLVGCGSSPEKKLIGEWKDINDEVLMVFNANGSVRMIDGNTVMDNTSEEIESMTWKLDASQDPMHLDLVFTPSIKAATQETQTIKMIARFIADNKLQVRGFNDDGENRPSGFTAKKVDGQELWVRQ